jgi:hypothetical protein
MGLGWWGRSSVGGRNDGKLFTGRDLLLVMQFLYPDVDDDQEPYEHPMTAVGVVLLSAALARSSWM